MPGEALTVRPLLTNEGTMARAVIETAWADMGVTLAAPERAEVTALPDSFRKRGGESWLIEAKGTAIGAAAIVPLAAEPATWELRWLCLHPHWRRMGIGGLALAKALAYAKDKGARHVVTRPPAGQAIAEAFLKNAGFVRPESGTPGPWRLHLGRLGSG
jgi:GNAT superfamily N-acetyltransferase